jgi:predicted nucleic acid-binding protein
VTALHLTQDLVIDASVAAKWLLRDEADVARADALLRRCDAGDVALFAPRQIEVEVAAALRKAILNQRLSRVAADQALANWLGPPRGRITLSDNDDLLPRALPRAIALGITLFDALYLVLAEELGFDLVAADIRFLRSPASQLPYVRALAALPTQ